MGVRVTGLKEARRDLGKLGDPDSLAEFKAGLKSAAAVVADDAKGRVPSRSGRAAASIRPTISGARAFVIGGRASVPYYGWLDFGTRTPRRGNPRSRGPWAGTGAGPAKGRFLYPALEAQWPRVTGIAEEALGRAIARLGLET